MNTWPEDELRSLAETDDLHIAPFRDDGRTYGTPTWIWSVVVNDTLCVRAYNGRKSRWHQAAMRQKAGRITAGGLTKEVSFEPVDGPITHFPPLEDKTQLHLDGTKTSLPHLLGVSDLPEAASDVHIRQPPVSEVEQVRELRFVPQAETLAQVERLAGRHREGRRPGAFQSSHTAIAESSDGLGRAGSIGRMRWHFIGPCIEEG